MPVEVQGVSKAFYEVSQLISQQGHSQSGFWGHGQVQLPAINHPTTANWAINQVQESFEQWQSLGFGTTIIIIMAAFGNILNSGFSPQAVGQRFL